MPRIGCRPRSWSDCCSRQLRAPAGCLPGKAQAGRWPALATLLCCSAPRGWPAALLACTRPVTRIDMLGSSLYRCRRRRCRQAQKQTRRSRTTSPQAQDRSRSSHNYPKRQDKVPLAPGATATRAPGNRSTGPAPFAPTPAWAAATARPDH